MEQLDHPEYRGKPVIVGGLPGDRRSVASTASYEARAFGVHSAMPISEAARLCPQGIFLRGNMRRYREKSDEIMAVFQDFAPEFQQLSIDEAFLDISGAEGVLGPPAQAAARLKARVRAETGLTISIGVASNKYVAKIASGISKPDGLQAVPPGEEEAFMRPLPVERIWGAGPKTQAMFRKYALKTCGDISRLSAGILTSIFGVSLGRFLYAAVRGQGAEAFGAQRGSRSMSAERTFEFDLYDDFALETALFDICQTLMWRLLGGRWQSRTAAIKIRYSDFSTVEAQRTCSDPVSTMKDLYNRLLELFREKYSRGRGVRLLGAGLLNLEAAGPLHQGSLFDGGGEDGGAGGAERERRLEKAILEINRKFPAAALKRGRIV